MMNDRTIIMATDDLAVELFGPSLVGVPRSVSPSVSQSVSQSGVTDELTNGFGVGGPLTATAARIVLPALLAQVVDRPLAELTLVAQYGRIVVARVVPVATVDPLLPFVLGAQSAGYRYWYRCYWRRLLGYLSNSEFSFLRRRMENARRRLCLQILSEGLTARECAYFRVWLEHSALGEYRWGVDV